MLLTYSKLFFPLGKKRRRQSLTSLRGPEVLEARIVPATDVLTYHVDIGSTGLNASETSLTPANVVVNAFGKLSTTPVDGQVYAEPLVDTGVFIASGPNTQVGAEGLHDVVYVATQHDSIYAIDAASAGSQVLWHRSFLDVAVAANNTLGASTITSVPSGDTGTGDITPEVGITGTPVIDNATGTLYVVVKTRETIGGTEHYVQRLHAIDVGNGTDRVTPYLIGDTVFDNTNNTAIYVYGSGDGSVTDPYNGTQQQVVQFNALREHQRGALNLVNNTVYVEWASHGDNGPYHGWVAAWDVSQLATNGMVLKGVLNTSPNDGLSGIWQGGGRLAFEPNGSAFYFETGNGSGGAPTLNGSGFPNDGNYNEALVKVVADPTTGPTHQNKNGWGLKVADYFIPFNVSALDGADSDFGSGAPILLPDSAGIPGHPHLMVAGGKEGKLYLLDRDNLGHFDAQNDHVLNAVPDGSGHNSPPAAISGLLSTPAWFNGNLYAVSGYGGQAFEFDINSNGTLSAVSQTSVGSFGYLPGSPSISANGTAAGIVWILDRNANQLHAYDASSLATELWNSGQKVGGGDSLGAVIKFAVPTVANGRVYVGTSNALVVYGLVQPPNAVPEAPTLSATALSGSAVRLTWTDTSAAPNTANTYLIEASTDGTNFSTAAIAPAGSTSIAIGGLQPLTHYDFRISGSNALGNSAYSNLAGATTTDQVAAIDFSGGFAAAAGLLQLNGAAMIDGAALQLTDTGFGEASSAFVQDRVDITAFFSQFTFQISPGNDTADGFTFAIQGLGATAIGNPGGSLGYEGINNSLAIKFDLYNNEGEGSDSTGMFTNGSVPFTAGSVDLSATGIDLHSGHVFEVTLAYDGTTLAVTITDTQTNQSATQNYAVDIPSLVGDNTAYVGFTGGTGGLVAVQDILTWTYSPTATISPNAPSGLGAIPTSATSVKLTWTSNATNQIGYHLDRALDAEFTQSLITEFLPANPSSFTDTAIGLAPGGTYYYRLRAFNSVGDSDNSNTVQVAIPLAPPKPTNQQVDVVTEFEIDISWQDNAGHLADGYRILRATNHGSFTSVATLPPTSRTAPSTYSWADTSVNPGTFYEYHIVAFNVSGNNDFAGVNASTLTSPPGSLASIPGASVVELSWTSPVGAVSFNVYRGTSPGGEDALPFVTGLTETHYADTDVTIGVTYYYKVSAVNANVDHVPELPSESALSNEVSATPTAYPSAPTDVVASAEINTLTPRVTLSWTAPFGATSFNVYRFPGPEGEGQVLLASGITETSLVDTAVHFGTTYYYYQISAVNEFGEGPLSNAVGAAPQMAVQINFTSSTGEPVPGYQTDTGLAFGNRGNGLSYGWNREDTAHAFDRDASNAPDELHDSFHEMQRSKHDGTSWSIALPNGLYQVRIIAGDPQDTTSKYGIDVTGGSGKKISVIKGQATADDRWLENALLVSVTQGTLSVIPGRGADIAKIDAIEISAIPSEILRLKPAAGSVNQKVTIFGGGFTGATEVRFNGEPAASFVVLSATKIKAVVPDGATTGPITVRTIGGVSTSPDFTVLENLQLSRPERTAGRHHPHRTLGKTAGKRDAAKPQQP